MGFILWLTRASLRVGVVAIAVKISIDNDVWSLQTDKTEKQYEKLKKYVVPGTIVFKEKIPQNEGLKEEASSTWNDSVNCVFNFLSNVPECANKKVNEIWKSSMEHKS